jgi:hypothetical protein
MMTPGSRPAPPETPEVLMFTKSRGRHASTSRHASIGTGARTSRQAHIGRHARISRTSPARVSATQRIGALIVLGACLAGLSA